jgi:beta-glucanase (GH16 family)
MPTRSIRALLAFLVFLLPITIGGSQAQGITATTPPHITYLDNTGLNFRAIPAVWPVAQRNTYQWYVNGKAVAGGNKLSFKATAKQKNQRIQFKEIGSMGTSVSVVGKIGQIIVNSKPTATIVDALNNKVIVMAGSYSPKTTKVTFQWFKGPIEIADARNSTYIPATIDQGFKIYVTAKYSAKGFENNTSSSAQIAIPVIKRTYLQVWQDEFNLQAGSAPDSAVWSSENGDGSKAAAGGGWGNKERQYYIPTLAKITSAGALQIDATTTGAGDYNCYYKGPCEWISSKYITKGKLGFKYGRIEARIKGPVGAGTWGAFWMLGADIDERLWPWCGEIDVTELVGKSPNTAYGYLHGLLSGGFGGRGTTVDMPNGFANDYHTYAVDWLPDSIDWYVDGVLFGSQQKKDKDWVFDHEFYLVVNLAMGGNLGGPVESGLKKANMSFDWIRFSTINGIGEVFKR